MLFGLRAQVLSWSFLLVTAAIAPAAELPKDANLDDTGFVTLFDGKSLDGWHVSAQTGHSGTSQNKSGGKWVIEEGAIVGSQDIPGNGGIILTNQAFGDFEVIVEMKNDYGPDSGLFLRSNDKGQAYQYMVDYHDNGNVAGIYGEGLPGGLHFRNYELGKEPTDFKALDRKTDPRAAAYGSPVNAEQWKDLWKHGEWNQLRARIVGNPPQITTWINGVKFMQFQDNQIRTTPEGMIALQVHGGGDFTKQFVRYRNVKVKTFGVAEPVAGKEVWQKLESKKIPGESLPYLLALPTDYKADETKRPLLLFLHGAGECGVDLNLVKIHGPPKLMEKKPGDFPFIVVSPQAPINEVPIIDRWDPRLLVELVDQVAAKYNADTDRLYVTGLSMGGYGTFRLCAHYPKKFAAAVPICGGGWTNYAEALAQVPMWIFHGTDDEAVPLERSLEIVKSVRKRGGKPLFTVYDGVAHDSWTQTYDNPEVYTWLLKHRLSNRAKK